MREAGSRLQWHVWACSVALLALAIAGCGSEPPPEKATLIIETTPESGADISLGGVPYGKSPLILRAMPAGQYYAVLELYGYRRAQETINVPETGEIRTTVALRPIVGYFTVETEPPGARVYLSNGDLLGTTPLVRAPVRVGMVEYEIRLDKFEARKDVIEIREDFNYKRIHQLDPLKGAIRVFSRPTGSRVFINDIEQEKTTPATFDVAPGPYNVGAYHDGFLMLEKTVEVEPQGDHTVDLTLAPGYMPLGMILVPAGEFIMGADGRSPDEKPRRTVNLPAYYIDKFEVTNKEFAKVFPEHTFDERKANHPVVGVTWSRATAYAQAVGKRLPTEEEWEKAARGTDGREFPWGNTFDPELCTILKPPPLPSGTSRVGLARGGASPYGALDMSGNAYEWTSTWYQPYPGNTEVKNEYGQIYRVLRGGSFQSDSFGVRAARRHYDKIDSARADYGFRCAMDHSTTPPEKPSAR